MQETTRTAVICLRISDDKNGDELGIERQREDCRKLTRQRELSVLYEATDNDLSAKEAGKRPEFNRMLRDVTAGRVNVIVAWTWERLTRNRRETVDLIEACQANNVLIVLVKGIDIDCSTAAGRLVADILAGMARNEIDLKSERQSRAHRQAAEAGKPVYIARPYGYLRDGTIVEGEALVLKDVAQKFLTGWSLNEVRDHLNDNGIPSATGKTWSRRVIKDHLLAPRNAGIRVYKGEHYNGTWTPIFDPQTHELLVAEYKRRGSNGGGRRQPRRYLLSGLLQCGLCGRPMAGHRHADRQGKPVRDKYACFKNETGQGCGSLMRVAETLDHFVREAVFYRLDSPELMQMIQDNEARASEIQPLRQKVSVLEARLEQLLDDYTDDTLSKSEYKRAKQRVSDELRATETKLATLYSSQQAAAVLGAGGTLRAAWETESAGWRRKLLELLIEKIIVHRSYARTAYYIDDKAYRFDPSAIEIIWKC